MVEAGPSQTARSDRFVYLRYPPKAIDVLGEAYRKDRLELDIQTLTGYALHGKKRPIRVFSQAGAYELHLQDANTAAGMTTHRLACAIGLDRLSAD